MKKKLRVIAFAFLACFIFNNLFVLFAEPLSVPEADNPGIATLHDAPELGVFAANLTGENLAVGKEATALSSAGPNPPELAVDGDTNTFWQAGNGVGWTYLEVDLASSVSINKAVIVLNGASRVASMFAEMSDDPSLFSQLETEDNTTSVTKGSLEPLFETSSIQGENQFIFPKIDARYFRIYIQRGAGNNPNDANPRISEIKLMCGESSVLLENYIKLIENNIEDIEKGVYGEVDGDWLTFFMDLLWEMKNLAQSGENDGIVEIVGRADKLLSDFRNREWKTILPPDFTKINPDDFPDYMWIQDHSGNKRSLVWYYAYFHMLANGVRRDEPNRGYIDIALWRNRSVNYYYNARVQENHVAFAFFYTTNESWNVYYNKPEVRVRLEAVLEHLLSLQKTTNDDTDGQWPEYSREGYNLAATGFGAMFLAETIRLLTEAEKNDPDFIPIDKDLMDRVELSLKRAITTLLYNQRLWDHSADASNQWGTAMPAILSYLHYNYDQTIMDQLASRVESLYGHSRSPVGYNYEHGGPDWSYDLSTVHVLNIWGAWSYVDKHKDDPRYDRLRTALLNYEELFWDWVSYNLLLEGDRSFFTLNAGIACRIRFESVLRVDCSISEEIPIARAFARTKEEMKQNIRNERVAYTAMWPVITPEPSYGVTHTYAPTAFLLAGYTKYYPSDREREEAISNLPYVARENFNHVRKDRRNNISFGYYRRPEYYASFSEGRTTSGFQNLGLGFVWHPEGGMMINSQNENEEKTITRGDKIYPNVRDVTWGTKEYNINRLQSDFTVFENSSIYASYAVNGVAYNLPEEGIRDMPDGDVTLSYQLGANGERGNKTVTFKDDRIDVSISEYKGDPNSSTSHPTKFMEHIPLLISAEDKLESAEGYFKLTRGRAVMEIFFDKDAYFSMENKPVSFVKYKMSLFMITADTNLNYSIKFSIQEPKLRANNDTLIDYNAINNIF